MNKSNTVGSVPNVDKPADVISFVFSNLNRYFTVGIGESIIKFAKNNSDLSMVNRLKNGFQEAIRLAVDKKQISEMLDALDEHLKTSKNKEIFTRVRETLVKSLEKANEELNKVSRQFKYFDLDPIKDSPEKILDKVVRARYGRFLFDRLDKIFRASFFFKAIIQFMEDDPEWRLSANIALTWGIQNRFIKGEQPGFLKRIFKDIGGLRFLSPRKLLGLAARGVVAGIVTDLTVQAAYKFGKDYLFSGKFKDRFGEELYEMKWYVNAADTIIPLLFNDLSKDKLGNVTKIAHLISMGFRDEENEILPPEDIGTLFGDEDYKDMDYKKTIRIFGEIYELVTGKRIPQGTIDNEVSLSQFLDTAEVRKIFALKEGRRLIPSVGNDGLSQFLVSYAGKNDDLGVAARYALKHKLDFVLVDRDIYTQEKLKDEYQDFMLFNPDNQDTYSGMTEEYLHLFTSKR